MTTPSDERLALEKRVADLGVTFPANIGDKKLSEKIKKHIKDAEGKPSGDGENNTPGSPDIKQSKQVVQTSKTKTVEKPSHTLRVVGPKR